MTDATHAEHVVQLVAPSYVKYNDSATLICKHNVASDDLHKIEFLKDDKKILQYVSGRKDPLQKTPLPGLDFEVYQNLIAFPSCPLYVLYIYLYNVRIIDSAR